MEYGVAARRLRTVLVICDSPDVGNRGGSSDQ
jgi:hypothetical protein